MAVTTKKTWWIVKYWSGHNGIIKIRTAAYNESSVYDTHVGTARIGIDAFSSERSARKRVDVLRKERIAHLNKEIRKLSKLTDIKVTDVNVAKFRSDMTDESSF